MRTKQKCACCGSILERQACGYCGFVYVAPLDEDAEAENINEANAYRKKIVGQIKNIRIISYRYGWREADRKYGFIDTESIRLADGNECNDVLLWTPQDFGQRTGESSEKRSLELEYEFNGHKRHVSCDIVPTRCDDFWHIGLRITKRLRMIVYLGREDNYSESVPIALDLR